MNFSEGVENDVLPPYLDELILKLLNLLQRGARLVQEGALTALASVADSSQVRRMAEGMMVGDDGCTRQSAQQKACMGIVGFCS